MTMKTTMMAATGALALLTGGQAMAEAHGELTVGYFLEWPMPFEYAKVKGLYDEALGMKVNWVSFDTGTAMSAAMTAAGSLDRACWFMGQFRGWRAAGRARQSWRWGPLLARDCTAAPLFAASPATAGVSETTLTAGSRSALVRTGWPVVSCPRDAGSTRAVNAPTGAHQPGDDA